MKSDEVLRAFFKKHGVKHLADALDLSEPFLYKWCQPDGGKATGGWNPLEGITAITQASGDVSLVQWLCQQCGGYFAPNPTAQPGMPPDLLPATGNVMREMGALQLSVAVAVLDHRVSRAEAAEIRQRWEDLKTTTEAYVRQCEGNVFGPEPGPVRRAGAELPPAR